MPENIDLIERICKIKKLNCKFFKIQSFEDYNKLESYDLIMAMGSLHHNPKEISKKIINILKKKFVFGNTKFLILSYPYERWKNDGYKPFPFWGENTDGGAPWTEYYDKKKIDYLFNNKIIHLDELKINDEFIIFYLKTT